MKKMLCLLLCLLMILSATSAFALNYQQHFDNEATFESLEEAHVNAPAVLSALNGRVYVPDPCLDEYPEGTTWVYRSAKMFNCASAAYRMNTNILVYTDAEIADKAAAEAYLKDLGIIDLVDQAFGSAVLVTPIDKAAGFGANDQYAYFLLQSAMFNLGFSVRGDDGTTYYADNTYFGGLTYRYLIGIDGGATFINDYVAGTLDNISRVAGMLLYGGSMAKISKVADVIPVYLVNADANTAAKYIAANDTDSIRQDAKGVKYYNQFRPQQAVFVAEPAELNVDLVKEAYYNFLIDAMRIPVIKAGQNNSNMLYSNYQFNQTPYSLCRRAAILDGKTKDGIYVIEHVEDRFQDICDEKGEYLQTWYEFLPEEVLNNTAPEHSVPLWLSNHGGGDDPVQFVDEIGLLELAGKERFALVGDAYQSLYYSTAVMADAKAALVKYMLDTYPALDPSRVYTTGYSMGGGTTVTMLASHPELFAAGAPQASGGSFIGSDEQVAKLQELGMPYFAMTSTYDVVGYRGQTMSAGVQAALNRYSSYFGLDEIEYDFETYPLSGFKGDLYVYTVLNNEYGNHTWYRCTEDGVPVVAFNLTENLIHALYPEYGYLAWDYVKQFSRDPETGAITYNPNAR